MEISLVSPPTTHRFEILPNEVWLLIFEVLDYKAIRFASVSKNFNNLVFQCITTLNTIYKNFNFFGGWNKSIVDIDDRIIQKFVNLCELNYASGRRGPTI